MSAQSLDNLIDLTYSIAISLHQNRQSSKDMSTEEVAEWVRRQLLLCGYPTIPVGSCWGRLVSKARYDEVYPPKRSSGIEIVSAGRPD